MTITSVERFILFSLGEFSSQANKKLGNKPLELSLSKADFIAIARKAKMTPKKERALYKNLESLQTKKLIAYEKKNVTLTPRGQKLFNKLHAELAPYLAIKLQLAAEDPFMYARKVQTMFSTRSER